MSHRYSWTSQGSSDQSPDEVEPDWAEIRFPIKIARKPGDRTDYSLYEFSAEVTTPDGELDEGSVRLRGGALFVRFQPYEEGLHKIDVLADGMEFCPPLFFEVSEDGSYRRLVSPPLGGHPTASRRQKAALRRRPSQRSSSQGSEEDEDTGIYRRGKAVQRSSSMASTSSSHGGLNRRGSFRQSDSSLERFAASSARYSYAGSHDDSSRPSSAGGRLRRNSSLSRHSSNASRQSFNRDAYSDSELAPAAAATRREETTRKHTRRERRESSGRRRTKSPPPTSPGRTHARRDSSMRVQSPPPAKGPRERRTSSSAGSAGGDVLVSPSGDTFLLSGGQALNLRVVGRTPSGAQLTQSSTGEMFMVQDRKAVPLQRGTGGDLLSNVQGMRKKGKAVDDLARCSVCSKKTRAKKRAVINGFTYCKKHFKKMYFKKSPYEHKAFLFEPPEVGESGQLSHPKANFTGIGFKEFIRAQEEFAKYDIEQTGSILKDLIRPILNSLLLLHPVPEKKLREYFLGPRYMKLIYDMGLAECNEVTELQFINLMAMIIRETTRNWLTKVKLDRPPMQKSWSTSVLEVGHQQQFAGYPGQPYPPQGMPPGTYGHPPQGPGYNSAKQRRHLYAATRKAGSEGSRFAQQAPQGGKASKRRAASHAAPKARRSDPDGLEDAMVPFYDEDDVSDEEELPPSSHRGVAVGQDNLEPAIGSTIIEETEDDDEENFSQKAKGKRRKQVEEKDDEEDEEEEEEEDDDDDDDDEDDDDIEEEDGNGSDSDSLPITGHRGADGWMLY